MKRIESSRVGIDRGEAVMFSDFEDDGPMWTGTGDRTARKKITFSEPFAAPPEVQVSLVMWDMDRATNSRADLSAEMISEQGFEAVFKTWGDTRIARARIGWLAIGKVGNEDDWDVT